MNALHKLRNNLFSTRAWSVLGPSGYARYLRTFALSAPQILTVGDLRFVDKAMGRWAKRFRYRQAEFLFDCGFCDDRISEPSFAFGSVREIYVRDCYFRWHTPSVFENARVVVDLGANRGAFSSLMTTRADFILAVEAQRDYGVVFTHNMELNRHESYTLVNGVIGASTGLLAGSDIPCLDIDEILSKHTPNRIDFMKLDIEGSEFALFESPSWLARVRALSMEVHREHGHVDALLRPLQAMGFSWVLADQDLRRTRDPKRADFLYATKDVP